MDDNPAWRGLQIVDTARGQAEDADGVVEFRATYRAAEGIGILHERSRFVQEDGRWFYVDGEVRAD
jgi:SEC-C motif-containing protein